MTPSTIAMYCFAIFSIILLLFAFMVLWKIFRGEISLVGLLAESPPPEVYQAAAAMAGAAPPPTAAAGAPASPPPMPVGTKASLARFQFLMFTFVIAGLYLLLSIEAGTFVDVPTNVLGLLGISGGTYVAGKAMK